MKSNESWLTKEIKILALMMIVGGVLLGLGAGYYKRHQAQSEANRAYDELLVRSDSPTLGNPTASVTIVEFFDPECESCRALAPVVKTLLQKYPGKIRLVLRYMTFHFNSMNAAIATEAAGRQGKYWEMHDLLFERQLEWGEKHESRVIEISKYAAELGLDMPRFSQDAEDPLLRQKIERDRADGERLGVRGTPTFFVNGKLVPEIGYEELQRAIEAAL